MFKNLGTVEIIIIAVIVLVFFGGKKLNDLAKGLGHSKKEFSRLKKEIEKTTDESSTKSQKSSSSDESH